jgi:hypothetical protein
LLAEAIANEPETTADIQIMNKEFRTVLRNLQGDIKALAKMVCKQDRARLVARYKKVAKALSADPGFRTAGTTFEEVTATQSKISRR